MIGKSLGHILVLLTALLFCLPLYGQEKDRPRNGEGVYSFLRRHNREAQFKEFMELNKGKFDKNDNLLLHHDYLLPPAKTSTNAIPSTAVTAENEIAATPVTPPPVEKGKKGREPLFGSELATYEVVSSELKGATFYIVSGHGGPDPGAIGKMGSKKLYEDEYAYDIALRLARNLLMQGATVHILIQDAKDGIRNDQILSVSDRETCMGEAIPRKQFARLSQRCDKINALYKKDKPTYSRAIFLHIDSRSIHKRIDVFFYHSRSAESKNLALSMRKTFVEKYRKHQPARGFTGTVEERSLYVINQTIPVTLFVELGNLQNSLDQQRFTLSNNRQALANWLCEGLALDYKNNKP